MSAKCNLRARNFDPIRMLNSAREQFIALIFNVKRRQEVAFARPPTGILPLSAPFD